MIFQGILKEWEETADIIIDGDGPLIPDEAMYNTQSQGPITVTLTLTDVVWGSLGNSGGESSDFAGMLGKPITCSIRRRYSAQSK